MFKITLLKQNIRDEVSLGKGIQEVKDAFTSINFPIEITVKDTTKVFTTQAFSNPAIGQGYCVDPNQILAEVSGQEDVAFLLFSNKNMSPTPLNPLQTGIKKGNCTPCQMCEEWYFDFDNVFEEFFCHELCHSIAFLTGSPDYTHFKYDIMWNGRFTQLQNMDYYLYLLTSLLPAWNKYKAGQIMYKYFKDSEIVGLKPELVALLDQARGIAGVPFKITSGLRTVAYNASIGGKVNSAHLTGEAVDLACSDAPTRWLIFNALLKVGLTRLEVAKDHIHCDISKTLPQNIIDFSADA